MAAFAAAVEYGVDGLELDIHMSRDGVPVVIHDETLDRTTDGHGRVCDKSWAQLQKLDAGSWFSGAFTGEPVPALEEVLKTFGGRVRLNLEIKAFDAGVAVLEFVVIVVEVVAVVGIAVVAVIPGGPVVGRQVDVAGGRPRVVGIAVVPRRGKRAAPLLLAFMVSPCSRASPCA